MHPFLKIVTVCKVRVYPELEVDFKLTQWDTLQISVPGWCTKTKQDHFSKIAITNGLLRPLLWQIKSKTTIYSLQEIVAMIREKSSALHRQDIIINCPIRGDIIAASTNAKATMRNGGRRGWQSVAEDLWHSVVAALSLNIAKVKTTYSIQFLLSQIFSALVWIIL